MVAGHEQTSGGAAEQSKLHDFTQRIVDAQSTAALDALGMRIKRSGLPEHELNQLRHVYAARKAGLGNKCKLIHWKESSWEIMNGKAYCKGCGAFVGRLQ